MCCSDINGIANAVFLLQSVRCNFVATVGSAMPFWDRQCQFLSMTTRFALYVYIEAGVLGASKHGCESIAVVHQLNLIHSSGNKTENVRCHTVLSSNRKGINVATTVSDLRQRL